MEMKLKNAVLILLKKFKEDCRQCLIRSSKRRNAQGTFQWRRYWDWWAWKLLRV